MKRYIQTLLEEMRELFSDKKGDKKVEQSFENFKEFQGSLSPSQEYREDLKSRLEGIYFLKHQKGGFWSNIKTWSNIAGFAFFLPIFVYIGYSMFSINTQTPLVEAIPEQTQKVDIQSIQEEDVVVKDLPEEESLETDNIIIDEGEVVEKNISANLEEIKQERIINQEEKLETIQNQEVEKKEIEKKEIEKDPVADRGGEEVEKREETPEAQVSEEKAPFLPESQGSTQDKTQESTQDENIEDEPSAEKEAQGEENFAPANASMMMSSDEAEIPSASGGGGNEQQEFQRICLEEIGGELIEEERICRLPDGTTCDEDEIDTCEGTEATGGEKSEEEKISDLEMDLEDMLEDFFGE